MIKSTATLALIIFLTGCGATYTFNGKQHNNAQSFQTAVDVEKSTALAAVTPLSGPLTKRKLIAAIPSEQAVFEETARRHTAITGKPLMGIGIEQNTNLSKANHKMVRVYFEAIQKKGIYSAVEIREMPSTVISIEPSVDYDVLYLTEPAAGSGQFFYASAKHGKQVFAHDRSGVTPAEKINAFVDAAQAQAIRE